MHYFQQFRQFLVLLVLKAGYFTNTTYGFIKWSKYIKNKQAKPETVETAENNA